MTFAWQWSAAKTTLTLNPAGYGQTEVTVTAYDARKASCTTSFLLLARNTYQALDVYPNPVRETLYVRPDSDYSITATLYSRSGAKLLSQDTKAGPFRPLQMDVRSLPAGTYTLMVDYGDIHEARNIVKY